MRISDWSSDVCSSDLAMCVISEGASIKGEGEENGELSKSASQRADIGVGHRLGRAITERLGSGVVNQELAYLMRAGEPDEMDRMVGFAFGGLAVQLLAKGETAGWEERRVRTRWVSK